MVDLKAEINKSRMEWNLNADKMLEKFKRCLAELKSELMGE